MVDLDTRDAPPTAAWATPKAHEAWRVYLDGAIKVRKLNSGVIQVATGDDEWKDAE